MLKKLLCVMMAVALVGALSGCVLRFSIKETSLKESSLSKETGTADQSESGETEEQEDIFVLTDTAVFDDLKVTANEIKQSYGEKYNEPAAGKVFVGVKFTVENISAEEQSVSSLLLFDAYVDDVKCDVSFSALSAFDEGTLDGSVAPGKKLVGWYAVEVPKGWSTIELHVKSFWLSRNPAKFVFENK